jgi:hypothetical protein
MKQHSEDDIHLKRYLLGELAQEERVVIEERLFLDPEYLLRLQTVEDELIDDYVYDELPLNDRQLFETNVLSRPGRDEDLRIAKALKKYTLAAAGPAVVPLAAVPLKARPPAGSGKISFLKPLLQRRPVLSFSLAAAALIIISVFIWFAVMSMRGSDRPSPILAQDPTPRPTGPVERQQHQEEPNNTQANGNSSGEREQHVERQVTVPDADAEKKQKSEQVARQAAGSRNSTASVKKPPARTVAFVLLPGSIVRGGDNPNEIALASNVGTVILKMPLLQKDSYPHYSATLQTGGRTLLRWTGLKSKVAESFKMVPVRVPARVLSRQSYQIKLSGISDDGQIHDLRTYSFQVVGK